MDCKGQANFWIKWFPCVVYNIYNKCQNMSVSYKSSSIQEFIFIEIWNCHKINFIHCIKLQTPIYSCVLFNMVLIITPIKAILKIKVNLWHLKFIIELLKVWFRFNLKLTLCDLVYSLKHMNYYCTVILKNIFSSYVCYTF